MWIFFQFSYMQLKTARIYNEKEWNCSGLLCKHCTPSRLLSSFSPLWVIGFLPLLNEGWLLLVLKKSELASGQWSPMAARYQPAGLLVILPWPLPEFKTEKKHVSEKTFTLVCEGSIIALDCRDYSRNQFSLKHVSKGLGGYQPDFIALNHMLLEAGAKPYLQTAAYSPDPPERIKLSTFLRGENSSEHWKVSLLLLMSWANQYLKSHRIWKKQGLGKAKQKFPSFSS